MVQGTLVQAQRKGDVLLENQIEAIIDDALDRATRASRKPPSEVLKSIGVGSYEHTNFRLFLSSGIVAIMNGNSKVGPIDRAWVHSIDITESDPSAADTSGDGSPCDYATGRILPLIVKVDAKNPAQNELAGRLNTGLVKVLKKRGIDVASDYLHVDFVTQADIDNGRYAAARVRSAHYPATQIWPRI
ncbi:MAG: hypothetical protein PHG85_01975 [Candidatus Altiarchaeota archaeon]|nr:hypothetical protein [Candidatus Altiarchaeota archaeon]